MAKKESTLFNMVSSLIVVALVASLSLGFTYKFTKEPIEKVKLKKKIDAIKKVVPEFDNNPIDEVYTVEGFKDMEFYPAKKSGKLVGTAVKAWTKKAFSGEFWLMVGLLPDGTIHNISVLEHKETPGLGSKMSEEKFKGQFKGVDPAGKSSKKLKVKKDGGSIDSITASTITSRAFGDAVQRAYDGYMKKKGGK